MSAADLPDVSSIRPKHPCRRLPATLHGVVFDIFCWELKPRQPGGFVVSDWLFLLSGQVF
jgi:hypothetical protein